MIPFTEHDRRRQLAAQALITVEAESDDPELVQMMRELVASNDPMDLDVAIAAADLIATAPRDFPPGTTDEEKLRAVNEAARSFGTRLGHLAIHHAGNPGEPKPN